VKGREDARVRAVVFLTAEGKVSSPSTGSLGLIGHGSGSLLPCWSTGSEGKGVAHSTGRHQVQDRMGTRGSRNSRTTVKDERFSDAHGFGSPRVRSKVEDPQLAGHQCLPTLPQGAGASKGRAYGEQGGAINGGGLSLLSLAAAQHLSTDR